MSRLSFAPDSEHIDVDVEAGRMRFDTRSGTVCDVEELRRALRDAGFDSGEILVDGVAVSSESAE